MGELATDYLINTPEECPIENRQQPGMPEADSIKNPDSTTHQLKSKEAAIAEHYRSILQALGENLERDGLNDTPLRAAKALVFLTRGYHQNFNEIVNGAVFESRNDEMVVVKDIELYSQCEHHLLPFTGKCHIAYLPNGKVLGLSKFARIVDMFARRLQIQENMTQQIAEAVMEVTGARGVAVVIEAKHLCMMMRGVEKQNSSMTSSVMLGAFRDNPPTRAEFLQLIK